jgi:hypothetical protein
MPNGTPSVGVPAPRESSRRVLLRFACEPSRQRSHPAGRPTSSKTKRQKKRYSPRSSDEVIGRQLVDS